MTWESLTREKPNVGLFLFTCIKHIMMRYDGNEERATRRVNEIRVSFFFFWWMCAHWNRAPGENWKNIIDEKQQKRKSHILRENEYKSSSKNNRENVSNVCTIIESIWLSLFFSPFSSLHPIRRKIILHFSFLFLTFIFCVRFGKRIHSSEFNVWNCVCVYGGAKNHSVFSWWMNGGMNERPSGATEYAVGRKIGKWHYPLIIMHPESYTLHARNVFHSHRASKSNSNSKSRRDIESDEWTNEKGRTFFEAPTNKQFS